VCQRRSLASAFAACALAFCLASMAACGGSTLPAGTYSSAPYHFKVSYPAGWQANISQQSGAAAPLILIITRSGSPTSGALTSSLTIDVLVLSDVGGPNVAVNLAKDKTLSPATISGFPGYQDQPAQQQGAGNMSAEIVTHTDYYLVHGDYEYQISLDALPGDQKTLNTMARSFTII
jgi:hypothetical protein